MEFFKIEEGDKTLKKTKKATILALTLTILLGTNNVFVKGENVATNSELNVPTQYNGNIEERENDINRDQIPGEFIDNNGTETLGIEDIYQDVKEQIINDYSKIYKLDNFSYDYRIRKEDNKKYIDLDVNVDMTLTRPASESPFIQGLYDALENEKGEENRIAIQKEIDIYTENIEMYYNKPDPSTFTYAIAINNSNIRNKRNAGLEGDSNNYELFYRNDASDETILINIDDLAEVEDTNLAREDGQNTAQKIVKEEQESSNRIQPFATSKYVTYDRLKARDWTNANGTYVSNINFYMPK